MKKIISKFPLFLTGFVGAAAFLMNIGGIGTGSSVDQDINSSGRYLTINNARAETLPQVKDQMVCHAGKILPVLNQNHSTKSLTCMKQSTQKSQGYNNLAEIFAEGWVVIDINNTNIWLLYK